jgi:uncharacterized membrane protein YoaK (UPF0700 family)
MNTLNLNDPWLHAVRVITPLVCLVWLVFMGRYSMRTWWRSPEGRHLMTMAAVLAVTFFLATILPWLNVSTRAKLVISCIVYVAIGGVGLHRHWLLTRADRKAREAREALALDEVK